MSTTMVGDGVKLSDKIDDPCTECGMPRPRGHGRGGQRLAMVCSLSCSEIRARRLWKAEEALLEKRGSLTAAYGSSTRIREAL